MQDHGKKPPRGAAPAGTTERGVGRPAASDADGPQRGEVAEELRRAPAQRGSENRGRPPCQTKSVAGAQQHQSTSCGTAAVTSHERRHQQAKTDVEAAAQHPGRCTLMLWTGGGCKSSSWPPHASTSRRSRARHDRCAAIAGGGEATLKDPARSSHVSAAPRSIPTTQTQRRNRNRS
jgi:hypothetical protein